jgi:membrane-bound serine protease (ClpP class)
MDSPRAAAQADLLLATALTIGTALLAAAVAGADDPDSLEAVSEAAFAVRPLVHVVPYDGPITPVASEYITDRIEQAGRAGADALVLQLDTPGGLDVAMRSIIKAFLAAPLPVIVYVAPSGARAASAGAFMTIAAHVAAMAPGTNIGSASPVQIGGGSMDSTMAAKVANDAAAYIASLARNRDRNAELARRMVTEAVNLTADEARAEGLIDVVAPTLPALLDSLQGRRVQVGTDEIELQLSGAELVERPMGMRQRLLKSLANPNLAYILMLLGIYGLFFELSNPGALVPGILGGICLLLALFAFQTLPVNYAGVGLILLGVVMLILEVKVTSFGALTLGGIASLVLGSLMLFDSPEPWARVSLRVLIPAVIVFAGFFVLCVWLVVRGHRRPTITGVEALIGERGRVVKAIPGAGGHGKVVFHGEMWTARSDAPLPRDATVVVTAVEGRIAVVQPVEEAK